MNVLILGSGGREHTLAWKINQSNLTSQLFVAPGNGGTNEIATNLNVTVDDFENIAKVIQENNIEMLIVGPEDPLVNGIRDYMESKPELDNLIIIGPGKAGAQLEGSKDFSKTFMTKHGIPTAKAATFNDEGLEDGMEYIDSIEGKIVLKADGLAAGKGVIICNSREEAKEMLQKMISQKMFGEASSRVLIEEYLEGIELSVFIITDGNSYKILPEAKDYKRIGEGDTGPNTGGMGAVSPVPFADENFMNKVENQIIIPTMKGLKAENIPYQGFLFIGLMNVNGNPYVIEYNVRMGDPESQVVIPRIKNDLMKIFLALHQGDLDSIDLVFDDSYATTVVMASSGYPGSYEKGKIIEGLHLDLKPIVFHAGTKKDGNHTLTNGGRVLALTGLGTTQEDALEQSYFAANLIGWEGCYYRKDIGADL